MLEKIRAELKASMLARDTLRTLVLRALVTALKNFAIDAKKDDVTEEEFFLVVKKMAKQRKDSIECFENAGQMEDAQKERDELAILEAYLPDMMSEEEIRKVVLAKKEALGITDASGFGKLMGSCMGELRNAADGDTVKRIVEETLKGE